MCPMLNVTVYGVVTRNWHGPFTQRLSDRCRPSFMIRGHIHLEVFGLPVLDTSYEKMMTPRPRGQTHSLTREMSRINRHPNTVAPHPTSYTPFVGRAGLEPATNGL